MMIGEVIRKYRKKKELTQEEMANLLGVTAPAVNKWENGISMPDISLLSPIARLLDVSLNELLSFKSELSIREIQELSLKLDQISETESYEAAFTWGEKQIEDYPNCEKLIYNFSVTLDTKRYIMRIPDSEKYDSRILNWYEKLLNSSDESMKISAADALYNYYLRNENYKKAAEYLSCFSMESLERKRKTAVIYEKAGETEKAYKEYEEILISTYRLNTMVFNSLFSLKCKENDVEMAEYYTQKQKLLAELFDSGEYSIIAADMELAQFQQDKDKTLACAERMLQSLNSLYSCSSSPLFSHIITKVPEPDAAQKMRESIIYSLKYDESFTYMSSDPRWNELLSK